MVHYVVYTHTDFLDICQIQTQYLKQESKSLIINSNNLNLNDLYNQYTDVIFYDDSKEYSSRLQNLNNIKDKYDYILLIHDIDIVIKKDNNILYKILELMKSKEIDKVDLQYDCNPPYTVNWYEECIDINTSEILKTKEEVIDDNKIYLSHRLHGEYLYNVNPSIWKLDKLLEILNQFPNLGYRQIESNHLLLQKMKTDFKIYQLYSLQKNVVKTGYYTSLYFFQFLHITHGGRLIPRDKNGQHNSLDESVFNEYERICNEFLKDSNRPFRRGMGEHE